MPLAAGDKLGPFQILMQVGAGGMGEVYKATDTRLGRTVAIKVGQERFSERFEREARAVASLNHSHICTLYDVGPNYLVMEYIEGQQLRGPLPLQRALDYAVQICDALEAAHRRGVVHRDLKPGNILVTPSGIKLLDFGLAHIEPQADDVTGDVRLTQPGVMMGTPAYMSPEQWEGKPGDARSDIYAFGCVLYEMLTGKRASQDRTAVEHATLEFVLRGCLEKDPDDRWQSARDVRRALQMPAMSVSQPRGGRRKALAWIVGLAIAAAIVVSFANFRSPPASTAVQLLRFPVYAPEKTVFSRSQFTTVPAPQFALSPDGGAIVFTAVTPGSRPVLWVRFMNEIDAHALKGTDGAEYPFWSPDSRSIAFFAQGKIRLVPAAGGPVHDMVERVLDPRGGSWGPNDTILFGTGTGEVFQATDGQTPVAVTKLDATLKEGSHRWPTFLPDGNHFLYSVRSALAEQNGVYVGSLDGRTKQLLVRSNANAVYAASGYVVFLQGTTLLAQAFDVGSLRISGRQFPVADGVGHASNGYLSISATLGDALAYGSSLLSSPEQLMWFDERGAVQNTVGPASEYIDFRLSHDGKRLAATRVDAKSANADIWVTDLTHENHEQQLTFGPSINAEPVWSENDDVITFRTTRTGGRDEFYQKSSAGGGSETPVLLKAEQVASGGLSPNFALTDSNDQYLLYTGMTSIGSELWRFLRTGTTKPESLLKSSADVLHANFSPNGQLVAYTSSEGEGGYNVWVETIPRSEKKRQISTHAGYEPRWRADGRMIYYLSEDRKLMSVTVEPAAFTFGYPKLIFQTQVPEGVHLYRTHYVPNRDGSRFLVNTQTGESAPTSITVVQNWTQLLKK